MKKRIMTLCLLVIAMQLLSCTNKDARTLREEFLFPSDDISYIVSDEPCPEFPYAEPFYEMFQEHSIFHSKIALNDEQICKEQMLLIRQALYDGNSSYKNSFKWMVPQDIVHYKKHNKVLFCYYLQHEPTDTPALVEFAWLMIVVDDQTGEFLSFYVAPTDKRFEIIGRKSPFDD